MSSLDWSPELAAALERLVPLEDGSTANWDDVVRRVPRLRRLRLRHPRRRWRFVVAVALLLLLLTGVATATYLLVRHDGGIAVGGGTVALTANPSGHGLRVVARCPVQSSTCELDEPTLSPDGTRLAFVRGRIVGRLTTTRMSLYLASVDRKDVRRLARCDGCGDALAGRLAWSPDSRWIAFSRANRHGHGQSIWVIAAAGGRAHRLCASCSGFDPTWSPNGSLIAFAGAPPGNWGPLYTVRADGSELRMIVTKNAADPEWAPDSRRIAFDTLSGIAVIGANGSDRQTLLVGKPATGPAEPAWSPNGRKLVYFQTPGHPSRFRAEIWTMDADGSDKKRLYRSRCCVGSWGRPTWSPDGRKIVFSADAAGGTFVINNDGTGLQRVSPIAYSDLSWQRPPRH
jgi:Tol biopolymer transport system component